jgi:ATP-dependent phosphofructokinase / diphosphate-dependent phosphofructokinase
MFGFTAKFPKLDYTKIGYKGGRRFGMLMSGGPASGANAVISTFSMLAIDNDIDVLGFYNGFEFLEDYTLEKRRLFGEGEVYFKIDREIIQLRNRGGSVLKVSRANPGRMIDSIVDLKDPKKSKPLQNVLEAFESLGVGVLVTIGGDDTLKIANLLHELGMPVVHVPKTIDNDYYGIPWTFGYWTAVEAARNVLLNLKRDAETTDSWFVVELMGRKAGWITYAAGIAGEADLELSAEDFPDGEIDLDKLVGDLADYLISREKKGKPYGVICVAESLVTKLPKNFQPKETDRHKNVILSSARIGELIADRVREAYKEKTGRSKKVTPFNVGYDIRCPQPNSFDVVMSCMLGYGAFKLITAKQFGHMVSVTENFDVKSVPFAELIDPKTLHTKTRVVPIESDFYNLQRMLSWNPVTHGYI